MYHRLLIPLDGSTAAEHALPWAMSLARRHGATLQIVHVHVPLWGVYGERGGPYDETTDRALRERERGYVAAVVERLAAAGDISLSSALLDGPVAEAISRHAAATEADLLIMTTHGRGPLARFWLGSVADALVRQATIPILFVRPQEAVPDLTVEPVIRRMLIPLDGSDLAEQILEPALALSADVQTEYTLLRVVQALLPGHPISAGAQVGGLHEPLLNPLQTLQHQELAAAQDYLARIAARLQSRSPNLHTRVVAQERPADAILAEAAAHAIDLIALATQGRGGWRRLLLGSIADKVLRSAAVPMLVYRPVDRSAPAEQAVAG